MVEREKSLNDFLLQLWPVNGEEQRFFILRFKSNLTLFCLISPLFLGIPIYLFRVMFNGGAGLASIECLIGLILLIPWLIFPSVVVLLYRTSKLWILIWLIYNLVFIAGWLVFLSWIFK